MADIKLSKTELAALDLLIAELQEAKIKGPFPSTTILTRVTATMLRTVMRTLTHIGPDATRMGPRATVYRRPSGARKPGGKVRIAGKEVPPNVTLAGLIELRRRASGDRG